MKTTKTYYIACDCKTGYVSSPPGLSTNAVEVCPVCSGSKIKPVIEVTEWDEAGLEKVKIDNLTKIITAMGKLTI